MRFCPSMIIHSVVLCLTLTSLTAVSPAVSAQIADIVQGYAAGNPPNDWVDKDTNHHVIRLTNEPDSKGLLFNENAFTSDGREMIYTARDSIYILDMTTVAHQAYQLVAGPIRQVIVGKKTPTVYFMQINDQGLYSVNVYTGQKLKIAELPPHATISTLNVEETLAAGVYEEEQSVTSMQRAPYSSARRASAQLDGVGEKHSQHVLFTLDLHTSAISSITRSPMVLGHALFSPTDPTLLMYWNEDPSSTVDHIWTVRTDGTMNNPVHERTMDEEVTSNAFWDSDGKTVWYDLQAPLGQNFYLASYNLETGLRRWYPMERDRWSIHYNAAVDDSVFCGDGSNYSRIAKSRDGQWIEMFSPRTPKITEDSYQNDQSKLIQSGTFTSHHLVNMSKDDYTVEPNARFSPDHSLVIFTSTMFGPSYLFAVEVRHTPASATNLSPK